MLRVLVVVVALTGVVRADTSQEAQELSDATLARYDREITGRNPLLKLYDLLDDSRVINCKHAREHLVEAKSAFDQVPKDDVAELSFKLHDIQQTAKGVDRSIDAYKAEAKTNLVKVIAGLALGGLLLVAGVIFALVKRRARR